VARRQAAQSGLRLADIEMDESVVTSPIAGVVDYLFQEEGEYVRAGDPLARVVQVDRVKFVLGIPERDLPHFNLGDPVLAFVDAYPDRTFAGRIHRIATSADPSTLTFITEVEIDNADSALRPGMMAKAVLIRKMYPQSIAIPLFSVLKEGERHHVFVERDGIAEQREITVGFFEGEHILVTDGLSDGDHLIVVGQRQLDGGEPVQVRETIDQPAIRANNPFAAR
jgi:membrane fusion protein (multidrug efflux system)